MQFQCRRKVNDDSSDSTSWNRCLSGVLEAIAFFRDSDFASKRFDQLGDVFETRLIGQRLVFIRGEQAITDLFNQADAVEGWWPQSVRELLGSRSLANRNGPSTKHADVLLGNCSLQRHYAVTALRSL